MKTFLKTILITALLVLGTTTAQAETYGYFTDYPGWARTAFGV